jgi:hypothetical protein
MVGGQVRCRSHRHLVRIVIITIDTINDIVVLPTLLPL